MAISFNGSLMMRLIMLGTDLPASILGIPLVDHIQERGKLILCRVVAVHIAVDSDESDTFLRKVDLSVKADFQIVSSESAHVLDDHGADQTGINIGQHLHEARSVEVSAGVAIIGIVPDVRETMLPRVVFQIPLLVLNRVAFPGRVIISGKPLI